MSDDTRAVASPSQTVGPFFHFGLTTNPALGRMAGPDANGEHIVLAIRVTDGDGRAVPDAMVELWQADSEGNAATSRPAGDTPFWGFGRLPTGDDGRCEFHTVRPGRTPDGRGGRQAPHVNVCFFSRGLLRNIFTRIYFAGDPALGEDAVLALVPERRRDTLLARQDSVDPSRWTFDLRLQGAGETVFFDL